MSGVSRDIPSIIVDILSRRGMTRDDMDIFLFPDYGRDLHDPRQMLDMDKAVMRILEAVVRQENVVVYGDYDIDGITATAVVVEALTLLGLNVSGYIPDRFEEGYGINSLALEKLQSQGAQLVVSVDCGITSVDEARWAQEHGLDLIITDHHTVPAELPQAVAVVNPKRPGDPYPFKELAGVGVAFKLVQALQLASGVPQSGQEKWLLDLVAMGTICDVVPLVGENRVLASYGLKVLRQSRRIGLQALAEVANVELTKLSAHQIGFILGPRMNAAGRLEHANLSLELVRSGDMLRAREIAAELEALNLQRRSDQAAIFSSADAMAEDYAHDHVLVLAHPDWSHGVVGIVASKLAEKWKRPVLLAQVLGERVKGSARSVAGFDMVAALKSQERLLSRYGGHFFAAGYSLSLNQLDELRRGLNQYYESHVSPQSLETPRAQSDISFTDLIAVDTGLIDKLALLEPYGNANTRPLVSLRDVSVEAIRMVGTQKQHLSLKVVDKAGKILGAIGFGLAERYNGLKMGTQVELNGTLDINEFQGRSSVQMIVTDIQYE
jgi:single-stranded-DNA-specific exonuclease